MADDRNLTGHLRVTLDGPSSPPPPEGGDPRGAEAEAKRQAEVEDKASDAAATALAAGLTILTAALGVFGGLTGSVARMARNYPDATAWGVSLVLASVVVSLVARLIHARHRIWRGGWLWNRLLYKVAVALFLVGGLVSIVAMNRALGDDDRPSVTAKTSLDASGHLTVAGTARAGGLAAEDQVFVLVDASGERGKNPRQVYYSAVGPNQDGVVEHEFSVLLGPRIRNVVVTVGREGVEKPCEASASAAPADAPAASVPDEPETLVACAVLRVPAVPEAPASGTPGPKP